LVTPYKKVTKKEMCCQSYLSYTICVQGKDPCLKLHFQANALLVKKTYVIKKIKMYKPIMVRKKKIMIHTS